MCYSLNLSNRLNEQDRIADQNLLIARRLQNIKPEYNADKWVSVQHYCQYCQYC